MVWHSESRGWRGLPGEARWTAFLVLLGFKMLLKVDLSSMLLWGRDRTRAVAFSARERGDHVSSQLLQRALS